MRAAFLVLVLAAAAPLFALASEVWWGLPPCELCLWQRRPYWAAVALAAVAFVLPRGFRAVPLVLAGLAAMASAAVAGLHVGVEAGWWSSPLPGCAAPTGSFFGTVDDMMRNLAPAPTKPCDEPTYLIEGLPLSMAGMNLIYGLGLGMLAWRLALEGKPA